MTDTIRNSLSVAANNVTMQYYFRLAGGGTDFGDTVTIGTIAGGDTASQELVYTFTQDDIGTLRIGSELTYYVMGRGPYNEFNVARDFVVEAAPTPYADARTYAYSYPYADARAYTQPDARTGAG